MSTDAVGPFGFCPGSFDLKQHLGVVSEVTSPMKNIPGTPAAFPNLLTHFGRPVIGRGVYRKTHAGKAMKRKHPQPEEMAGGRGGGGGECGEAPLLRAHAGPPPRSVLQRRCGSIHPHNDALRTISPPHR